MASNDELPIQNVVMDDVGLKRMFIDGWYWLAPSSYRGFVKHGRGLLLADLRSNVLAEQWPDGRQMANFNAYYVPQSDVEGMADRFGAGSAEMVRSYAPELTILLWIELADGNSMGMFINTPPGKKSPKTLYEEEEARKIH